MSINILGGVAKSHSLKVPLSSITRPTSVLLRRKIFDSKQNWENKVFIDACAGSGAMGLEAWSRGAARVILIESQRKAFQVLKSNVDYIQQKFESELIKRPIKAVCSTFQKYLKEAKFNNSNSSMTIFLDPPYENHSLYSELIDCIEQSSLSGVELWVESDKHKGPPFEDLNLEAFHYKQDKLIKQGSHFLGIFSKEVL